MSRFAVFLAVCLCCVVNTEASAQDDANRQILKELAELRAEVKALRDEVAKLKGNQGKATPADSLVRLTLQLLVGENNTTNQQLTMMIVRRPDGKVMASQTVAVGKWKEKSKPTLELKLKHPIASNEKDNYKVVISMLPETDWRGRGIEVDIQAVLGFDEGNTEFQLYARPSKITDLYLFGQQPSKLAIYGDHKTVHILLNGN